MNHPHPTPDDRIDQVLQALRGTATSANLEARIVASLHHRASAAVSNDNATSFFSVILNAGKDPRILFAEARLYTLAGAFILLAALSLFALHAHHPAPTRSQVSTQVIQPPSQRLVPSTAQNQSTTASFEGARLQSRRTTNTNNSALANEEVPPPQPTIPQPPSTPTDPDTLALAQTVAPSHPAPPMPLTQQERLMLAVLQSGDQEEIAALDPAQRDFLFAKDRAAFQNFFAPLIPATPTGDKE